MGDSVAFTDGFRSIKDTDKIKAYAQTIEYNVDSQYDATSGVEYGAKVL
jgi:hypothetical protein